MKIIILLILIIILLIILNNNKEIMVIENVFNLKAYKNANILGKKYINSFNILPNKGAVMFDIDDTLLFVKNKLIINNQGLINTLIPIRPIINLLNFCLSKNLLIIIITARDNKYKQETINDLNKNSINYSFLYCRHSPQDNHDLFKSDVKENLKNNHGIEILMSVGDQLVDVIGPCSGYGIKLPNKSNLNLYESSLDSSKLIQVK